MSEMMWSTVVVEGVDQLKRHRRAYFDYWAEAAEYSACEFDVSEDDGRFVMQGEWNYGFDSADPGAIDTLRAMAKRWDLSYTVSTDPKYEFPGTYESWSPGAGAEYLSFDGQCPCASLSDVQRIIGECDGDHAAAMAKLLTALGAEVK